MEKYSIGLVAKISNVSKRTLQYYDKIGLLKPSSRADSRYRYYGKDELYRLQQILFFKELDFPLKKIALILDDPNFDIQDALSYQKLELEKRKSRLGVLLNTIEKTIQQLKEENKMVTETELYDGFSKDDIEAMKKEVDEKYNPELVKQSYDNIKKMTKADFGEIKEEQENIAKELALVMHKSIDSNEVQELIKRHHSLNEKFYETNAQVYKGLADMYITDSRFMAYYDKHTPGLAKFLRDAMYYYIENTLLYQKVF